MYYLRYMEEQRHIVSWHKEVPGYSISAAFSSGLSLKLQELYLLCPMVLAKVSKWVNTCSSNSENQ